MSKDKFLLISYYFTPSEGIAAQRAIRMAKYLKQFGWSPMVLTIRMKEALVSKEVAESDRQKSEIIRTPCFSFHELLLALKKRVSSLKRKISGNKKKHSGVMVESGDKEEEKLEVDRKPSWLGLFLSLPDHYLGWSFFAIPVAVYLLHRHKQNHIVSTAPPWTNHVIALVCKKFSRAHWTAHFEDPWLTNPWHPQLPLSLQSYVQFLEAAVVKNADKIICNTIPLMDDFVSRYPMHKKKMYTVSNGFDPDNFKALAQPVKKKRLIITHAGSLYGKRNPSTFLNALGQLTREVQGLKDKVKVILLGNIEADFLTDISAILLKYDMEEMVDIKGMVSKEKALQVTYESDILLIIQPQTAFQVPGKLYEYLAVSKPVLALTDEGPAAALIEETQAGIAVPSDDGKKIQEAVKRLFRLFSDGKLENAFSFIGVDKYAEPYLSGEINAIMREDI